jgi:hypothetical protein
MADDLVNCLVYMCTKFKQDMEAVMAPYREVYKDMQKKAE